jgi:hypothetical protein
MKIHRLARSSRSRGILAVAERFECPFDEVILDEQLHTRRTAFHAHAHTGNDGRNTGNFQLNPRQIGFDPCRVGLDDFHR